MVQKYIDYRPCPTVELENNDYLVETAGFELENAFQMSEFDINDDDDIFTATEKITARNNYIAKLKKSYSDLSAEKEAEKVGNNSTSKKVDNTNEPVIDKVAGDK